MPHPAALKLSVGNLLALTTIVAICCAGCLTPSPYSAGAMLVLTVVILVFAVQRACYSPPRRPFWLSFLAGVAVLLLFNVRDRTSASGQFFQNVVVDPLWSLVQHNYLGQSYSARYENFYMSLHLTTAIVVSALAAFLMQFVSRNGNDA
jgi:hypothetical protein